MTTMTDNELFGNSEQLDTISRQGAIKAIKDALLSWSNMPEWRDNKIVGALDKLPPAQQWIPCSERLPRAFETVNVTVQIPEGRYVKESALVNGIWEGINVYAKVVAWCPLPAPWKGEQNG